MIIVNKSITADSRTCDPKEVTKQELLNSTENHIFDVRRALQFFRGYLDEAITMHDDHKLDTIDRFHEAFQNNMEDKTWWDEHQRETRHHLKNVEFVQEDVNLIDVIEYISDCVMAGMARTGSVYDINIDETVLMKAFKNTIEMLKSEVKVSDVE